MTCPDPSPYSVTGWDNQLARLANGDLLLLRAGSSQVPIAEPPSWWEDSAGCLAAKGTRPPGPSIGAGQPAVTPATITSIAENAVLRRPRPRATRSISRSKRSCS
jgi:hypothetical protein